MTQDEKKRAAAHRAIEYLTKGDVIGVGTGSTANYFIEELIAWGGVSGAVASSEDTAKRLMLGGVTVLDLNEIKGLDIYVDGADEINDNLEMIKGGGGALTREKIVSAVATTFVCIVDDSKVVEKLGKFPLPVEVIPMATSYVAGKIEGLGGAPMLRQDFVTDNGNVILDIEGLDLSRAREIESQLDGIVGVVTNGLFAKRSADVMVVGEYEGAKVKTKE